MMLRLTASFLFSILSYTKGETGEAYHGPAQARELFSYNDKLYYFYSDKCAYEEAAAICQTGDMHLATLDDPGKAKFAAESIAEAWMVFEDMWIGARKGQLGKWNWTFTGKLIPDEPQMIGNYTYLYPPWVDNQLPARDGKDCLAIDRNGHNDPYFVDLDCKLPRPFICEQNYKINNSDPWSDTKVDIFEVEFILYHGRLSWAAAVSFCEQQGYALATIENMTIARKLAKAMLKSRPEFEDAWIGANFKNNEWLWVETGEEVKELPPEYKDPEKGDLPENIITPRFPPWFESVPRRGRECVIFDRHLCDEPKFIDLKCNRQRDFICIKREKKEVEGVDKVILDRAKKRYIFFPVAATWDDAKKICDDESEDATMLNLTDAEETKFIMQAMADARNPINHLWIGGKIINNEWVWISRDLENGPTVKINPVPDASGFPPWCDNETSLEMSCLNLDRQNHWTPLMYGLECNTTQAVVCVKPVETGDRVVLYEGSGTHDPAVKVRVSILPKVRPISWDEAEKFCKRDVGKLWKPRFDLAESASAIKKFFANLKKDQDKDKTVEVYHVDGGRYSATRKAWIHSGKAVNITTAWEPNDGDCLIGQIGNDAAAAAWAWYPVKCHHRLYSQVICQPICSLTDVPYEDSDSEWLCDASPSELFDHKMTGMGCSHRCHEGHVSQGPDRYYCDQRKGWYSVMSKVPVQASTCKDLDKGLESFKNIPKGIASLAFVLDSTSNSVSDYSATKYLMGNLIDYYRSHVQSITVYVVSIQPNPNKTSNAVTKVSAYKASGVECDAIKKNVLDLLVDSSDGVRDYSAGLTEVRAALEATVLGEANIVFIVPEANQKNEFKAIAREINEDATVYAIGTNRYAPIGQLVEVASIQDGESFAIQFKKPPDVITSVKALMKDCKECKCATAFNSIVEKLEKEAAAEKAPAEGITAAPAKAPAKAASVAPAAAKTAAPAAAGKAAKPPA